MRCCRFNPRERDFAVQSHATILIAKERLRCEDGVRFLVETGLVNIPRDAAFESRLDATTMRQTDDPRRQVRHGVLSLGCG